MDSAGFGWIWRDSGQSVKCVCGGGSILLLTKNKVVKGVYILGSRLSPI